MILIRALGAYIILFSFSIFVFANARELTSGVAYNNLLVAIVAFGVIFFLSGDLFSIYKVQPALLAFIVFVGYFGVKYYLESADYEQTKQYLIGTSNGIVFSLFVGFMSAYALTVIYEMRRSMQLKKLAFIMTTIYLAYVVFLAYGTFNHHFASQSGDKFLIDNQEGYYQRTGDFLLMQFILASSLFVLMLSTTGKFRFIACLPLYLALMATAAIFGLTAQLVGSNMGLIGPVTFMFVVSVIYVVLSIEGSASSQRRIGVSSYIFGRMKLKLLFGSVVSVGLLVGGGMLALHLAGIDIDTMRVTNYGEGENTSLVSRNELFRRNFLPHFSYNPIFGHTNVHNLAGHRDSYVHSLASILTHLGLVGFAIFSVILTFLYLQINSGRRAQFDALFSNQQYGLYRLFAILGVLAMCSAAAFFTWMPMWFAFGMFGEWINRADRIWSAEPASRGRRHRRRRRQTNAAIEIDKSLTS